jgi:predicted dehydrogenase
LKIGFVSTAHIHTKQFIEKTLQATDGRKIGGIWDDVPDRGKKYAGMAGAPFVPDLGELLADPTIDGFAICAENTRHLPLLQQVLPVGKPVFCEKPLVTNLDDLKEVCALVARHPAPLFCGYFQPWTDQIRGVMQRVGEVGAVIRVRYRNANRAAYGRWFDPPDLQWFTRPELSGGGAFLDMGTHALHLMRTLFGPVSEVWAEIGNHAGIYPAVDDYGIAHLRFFSGVLGTVEAAWTQTGGINGLEIVGSEKTIWNTGQGYVITGSDEPIAPRVDLPNRIDRLIAVIQGKIPAEELQQDLEATFDTVAIMAAAYESAAKGEWIKVAAI